MACQSKIVVTMGMKRRMVARKKSPRYVIRSISATRRILVYLRNPRTAEIRNAKSEIRIWDLGFGISALGVSNSGSTGFVLGFMVNTSFLKDTCNHLVQRRILDAHVDDGVAVEDRAQDLGDARPLDLEVDNRVGATSNLTKAAKVLRRRAAVEMELHQLGLAELFDDLGQRAVVDHFAMTDDQYTGTEGLDVAHVVAGQE